MEIIFVTIILLVAIICVIPLLKFLHSAHKYKHSEYQNTTQTPFRKTWEDKGQWGEYLTFLELDSLVGKEAKFLFNCYVPKHRGSYTELT